ncbi:MAG TPA: hypothetical protein DEG13_02710, partial [Candidatus Microthrix parvicella]|nr:hypothetical protein [Candidatus Microthrix parvicella]
VDHLDVGVVGQLCGRSSARVVHGFHGVLRSFPGPSGHAMATSGVPVWWLVRAPDDDPQTDA